MVSTTCSIALLIYRITPKIKQWAPWNLAWSVNSQPIVVVSYFIFILRTGFYHRARKSMFFRGTYMIGANTYYCYFRRWLTSAGERKSTGPIIGPPPPWMGNGALNSNRRCCEFYFRAVYVTRILATNFHDSSTGLQRLGSRCLLLKDAFCGKMNESTAYRVKHMYHGINNSWHTNTDLAMKLRSDMICRHLYGLIVGLFGLGAWFNFRPCD
jgi:hypothetical protein